MIFYGGQFFLWNIFFRQFPLVGGWTSHDVMVVYSLYTFSFAVLDVFAGGVTDLAKIINAGGLDYYLVFPKPLLWHIAVSKSDVTSLGTIILSSVCFLTSEPFAIARLLTFFLASCFTILLLFNFLIITQSIAFFIGGFDQGASALRHLLTIVSPYPFAIFSSPFKYIFMTFIPSFFIVTLPAQLISNFTPTVLAILILACIVSSFCASKIFKKGLSRYESGNLVNVRI